MHQTWFQQHYKMPGGSWREMQKTRHWLMITPYIAGLMQKRCNSIANSFVLSHRYEYVLTQWSPTYFKFCPRYTWLGNDEPLTSHHSLLQCGAIITRDILPIILKLHDDVIKWNIFHVTGPLCGEFTGYQWISHTKARDAELWCFLWSRPEWTVE